MSPRTVAILNGTSHQMKTIAKCLSSQYQIIDAKTTKTLIGLRFDAIVLHHATPLQCCIRDLQEVSTHWPKIPVIVLTEPVPSTEVVELFRYGIRDLLFLPVHHEELLDCLCRFIQSDAKPVRQDWLQKIMQFFGWDRFISPSVELSNYHFISPQHSLPAVKSTGDTPQPDLQVQFFGNFSIHFKGRQIDGMLGKKARMLMAYLFFKYPRFVHRDVLVEKFWGDSSPDSARNCLHVTLHAIRKIFEQATSTKNTILYEDDCYGFHPDILVERDISIFKYYWKKGSKIEREQGFQAASNIYHQAFAFYKGDFLEDMLMEEWTEHERSKLRETWLVILDRLSAHFFEQKRYKICINLCERMLEKDSCLEEAHRRLMECYHLLEMKDKAIRQFKTCEHQLIKELDTHPGSATIDLYLKIRENL